MPDETPGEEPYQCSCSQCNNAFSAIGDQKRYMGILIDQKHTSVAIVTRLSQELVHLRGESVENIDLGFWADLASIGSKLMRKEKKWPSPYVKWCPKGG